MKIGLKFKAYESSRIRERLRRDGRLDAGVKIVNGESLIVVNTEFRQLKDAREVRRQLLSDFSDLHNADREVSVMLEGAKGFIPLFDCAVAFEGEADELGERIEQFKALPT